MGCRVRIGDDDIVNVSCDTFDAFDDLVDYLDEPAGGGTTALRHDEPLEKPVKCVEGGEGNAILVDGLIWWKEETRSHRAKRASFTQGVEDFVNAGDWELREGADVVQFLQICGDASIFLGDGDHWAVVWRSRVLDEAGGQVLVYDSIRLLGKDRVHLVVAGGDGGAVRWDGDLERGQGARAEVGLGSGEDARQFAKNVAQVVNHRRCPASTVEVVRDAARAVEGGPKGVKRSFVGR